MTLRDFYTLIDSVGVPVAHYETDLEEYPYIIYQEYATTYMFASSKAYTETAKVEVIHFSQTEFDPSFELLKKILLDNGIFFSVATTFDRDTKVIQNQLEVELTHEVGEVIV